MKILKTTTSKSETSTSLDLFEGVKLSPSGKDKVREEVGTFIVEQTLVAAAEGKSPVQGESIPSLSKGPYRKRKLDELGTARADLQYSGETLDEFTFRPTKDGIKIGVFGERAPILDGHANLSGKSSLPRRRILPDEGQAYKKDLATEIDRIVADAVAEETSFSRDDFEGIETKGELFAALKPIFGGLSRAEIRVAVYRNEDLLDLLNKMKLLKLLE